MVNFSEFRIVSNIGAFYLKKKRLGSTSVSVFWNKKSTLPVSRKIRHDHCDMDYKHKLDKESLEFLNAFNQEYYNCNFKHKYKNLHKTKEDRKICYDRNNALNRDIYSLLKCRQKLIPMGLFFENLLGYEHIPIEILISEYIDENYYLYEKIPDNLKKCIPYGKLARNLPKVIETDKSDICNIINDCIKLKKLDINQILIKINSFLPKSKFGYSIHKYNKLWYYLIKYPEFKEKIYKKNPELFKLSNRSKKLILKNFTEISKEIYKKQILS